MSDVKGTLSDLAVLGLVVGHGVAAIMEKYTLAILLAAQVSMILCFSIHEKQERAAEEDRGVGGAA